MLLGFEGLSNNMLCNNTSNWFSLVNVQKYNKPLSTIVCTDSTTYSVYQINVLKQIYNRTVSETDVLYTGPERSTWSFSWSFNVHWSLIRNGHSGRVTVKKTFLRKRNLEKKVRYSILNKTWSKNHWQQVWWSDEIWNFGFKLCQNANCSYYEREHQERGPTMSVYSHL